MIPNIYFNYPLQFLYIFDFLKKLLRNMRKLLIVASIFLFYGCNTNPNYEKNLATAKKLFELHGEEDLEGQLALISDKIQSNSSMYGSETVDYDQYVSMLKGYHAAFDDIKYTADIWLPGTDTLGNLDGSVRTYGSWSGVNVAKNISFTIIRSQIIIIVFNFIEF